MTYEDVAVQLELKERLNYPEYIQKVIENINSAFNNEKISRTKVQEMIINFYHDIPRSWKDEQFKKDIQDVVTEKSIPNIIDFCGYPMSKEYMKENKIPLERKVKQVNYYRLKNAIINLLDRLNMLVRKDKIEKTTGRNIKYETLDDLLDDLETEDNGEE